MADPTLSPKVKELYLDRTLLGTREIAEVLGFTDKSGPTRVSMLRTSVRRRGRTSPHPAVLPEADVFLGVVAGVPVPAVEHGRLREWAVQRGTHHLDPDTGNLIKEPGATHGRPRSQRPSLSTGLRNPKK